MRTKISLVFALICCVAVQARPDDTPRSPYRPSPADLYAPAPVARTEASVLPDPLAVTPLSNGSFESNGGTGTNSFTDWGIFNQSGSSGSWYVQAGTLVPGGQSCSGVTVPPPTDGVYAAMTSMSGPGTLILYQDIVVPIGAGTLLFDLYINNNLAGTFVNNGTLDYSGTANQYFRADIVSLTAAITDVGSGVLQNLYITNPGDPSVSGYTTVAGSIAAFAGQTVRLRFANVNNQNCFFSGIDNVRIFMSKAAGDFNGDGKSDVFWRNGFNGQDVIWLMNGTSIASAAFTNTVSDTNWKVAGTGDFNGDGKADVIWLNNATGQVVIWLMNGAALSSAATVTTVSNTNWKIVGVGDFNGDGKSDVFWRNSATGEDVVWLMNGTSISSAASLNTVSDLNWSVVGVGDFNGDGKADVFWRNTANGQDVIYLMNGAAILSAVATNTVATSYKVVGVGDVNGDGKADVVWWNQSTGDVVVWQMNGTTIAAAALVNTVSDTNWHVEGVGDFDGDGKTDLMWRKVTTGETVVWLMNGLTIKQAASVVQVNDLNWSIVAPR